MPEPAMTVAGESALFADPSEIPRSSEPWPDRCCQVPEPKTVNNRLHLDLRTDRFEAESQRLTGLGATPIRAFEKPEIRWTTFADPKDNEFDLVAALQPASGPGE